MVSGSAFADSFTFTSPGGNPWDGVYVNPYQATDNTQNPNNPLTIYCDDWNTEFSGNPTWNATVLPVTPGNVPYFKYGGVTSDAVSVNSANQLVNSPFSTTAYDLYLGAVYLDQLMQGTSDATTQQELSAANWLLFVTSANAGSSTSGLIGAIDNSGSTFEFAVAGYLNSAQNDYASVDATGWDVITPVGNASNGSPMQEFLTDNFTGQPNQVPEPSAVILLGTIVGLLGLTKFRRGRQA